jgi:hypothetical protein
VPILLNTVRQHLSRSGILVITLSGCGTGPGEREFFQYHLSLTAYASDTTPERIRIQECTAASFFDVRRSELPEGTARFPLTIHRGLVDHQGSHTEITAADTNIAEAVLEYGGLGDDSLRFTLGAGPYTVSLGPEDQSYPGEYSGEWICGPAVPMAHDSTLVAYGYDPNVQIPGTWRVTEIIPIE